MPSLLAPQRDRRAVDTKLERIAAERAPEVPELGALNEAEHHEPLNGGPFGIDRLDPHDITGC
jgi:hypothetical protein